MNRLCQGECSLNMFLYESDERATTCDRFLNRGPDLKMASRFIVNSPVNPRDLSQRSLFFLTTAPTSVSATDAAVVDRLTIRETSVVQRGRELNKVAS